ncbi:hypothetical protein [Demequina pelophila]|uniref:hypothetical protein n=1 Tax=Demequina pelophila TaxID=1638984 RepID=UPI0007820D2A|nr:hypothetical protein [Demequina pelophila]
MWPRKGLWRRRAVVLDGGELATVLWESGEVGSIPLRKMAERADAVVPSPDVRSRAGRLTVAHRELKHRGWLTPPVDDELRKYVTWLLTQPGEAVGLLLDASALNLTVGDFARVPIDPWRVKYEFLRGERDEHRARNLARQIVADTKSPAGVRATIALRYGLEAAEARSLALLADCGEPGDHPLAVLQDMAHSVADTFAPVAGEVARKFRLVATKPWLAEVGPAGRLLAAHAHATSDGPTVQVEHDWPLGMVDDLIERGVPLEVVHYAGTAERRAAATLATYVRARTAPEELTSDQVVSLRFHAEALRRHLAGDSSADAALAPNAVDAIRDLRTLASGGSLDDLSEDPLIRSVQVLESRGPSDAHPPTGVLVDRSLWPMLIERGIAGGTLRAAEPIQVEYAELSALRRASDALFDWHWDDARAIARSGLGVARREAVRDELLNIIACSLWLQGEPESALGALNTALEGEYTDALVVNAAVVATALEHESAARHLVKLATEAPSAHQRAIAAERALMLWFNDDGKIWDDSEQASLPAEIAGALRPLIKEDLPAERYRNILNVLANQDDAWLCRQPESSFGRNANTPAVRVYQARARGPEAFLKALGAELRGPAPEEWIARERDQVVDAAIQVLLEDAGELRAAAFGLTVIDANLPMEPHQRIALKCLTVASIAMGLDEGEPNLRFIDFVSDSKRELNRVSSDERARLVGLVDGAGDCLARAYVVSRASQLDEISRPYTMLVSMVRSIPRYNVNWQAVSEMRDPLLEFVNDTRRLLTKLMPLADDYMVRSHLGRVLARVEEMKTELERLRP